MKIAVYGATGMIGSDIVAEAVSRGHEVTAYSRNGGEVAGISVHAADLADADTFAQVAEANDAVVLATSPSRTGDPHSIWLDALATAIANAASTRLLVVGGAGSLIVDGKRILDSPDFPDEIKPEALSGFAALEKLRNESPNELDWVMLAPAPSIEPGVRTGSYKSELDTPAGESISTEDFAVAMLDEIETPKHHRTRFTVAN